MKHQHLLIINLTKTNQAENTLRIAETLANNYPALRITVLGDPSVKPLFDHNDSNINFMAARIGSEYHGVKGLNALYRRLVAKQPTHIADLSHTKASCYLRIRFNMGRFRVQHTNKHHTPADVFRRLGLPM